MNHPNRHPGHRAANPTPEEVIALRGKLTQVEAGKMCFVSQPTWANWEAGDRRVHPLMWWAMTRIMADVLPVGAKIPSLGEMKKIMEGE